MAGFQIDAYGIIKRILSHTVAKITETLLPDTILQLRMEREWKHWTESLIPEILEDLTHVPMEVKQRVFKTYVRRVEIETHAKCNRNCSFCPNSTVDRQHNESITDAKILDRTFRELGSINYTNQILVARYSEPLVNQEYLCEQITRARSLVQHAEIAITTNTDHLTPIVLDRLRNIGLNVVYMSIYLKKDEQWTPELAYNYSELLAKKLGIHILSKYKTPLQLFCNYSYKGLILRSICSNWNEYGTDRGGSIKQYSKLRLGPCRDPFETFVIDHTGAVLPCSNLRSDLPQHRNFIIGNLSIPNISIFDIYTGKLVAWRRNLLGFGKKVFPCETCKHRDIPESLIASIAIRLENQLYRIGLPCML